MTTWLKLLIPLLLGGAAALCNYLLLVIYTQPETFLQLDRDVAQGEPILPHVKEVQLSGRVSKLLTVAVSGRNYRSLLQGRNAARPLKRNDLLLWQDVVQPSELQPGPGEDALTLSLQEVAVIPQLLLVGQQISFVVKTGPDNRYGNPSSGDFPSEPQLIGPFRLLSVGSRLNRTSDEDDGSDYTGRTITVAIPAVENGLLDIPTRELLQAIAKEAGDRSAIKAIVLHRPEVPTTVETVEDNVLTSPAETPADDNTAIE